MRARRAPCPQRRQAGAEGGSAAREPPPARGERESGRPQHRSFPSRPQAPPERGRLGVRAADLRRRRRDGRCARGRDRLARGRDRARRGRRRERRGSRRRAHPAGEQARLQALERGLRRLGDGDDDHRRGRRGRHRHDRSCRRLARLSHPRPQARAADRRPLPGRRARSQRPALARGGRIASTALRHHPGDRHRPRRRRRLVLDRGEARRSLPDLLRRADVDGRRRGHSRGRRTAPGRPRRAGEGARGQGQPKRRRGQHHGRLLRDRRGRSRAAGRYEDDAGGRRGAGVRARRRHALGPRFAAGHRHYGRSAGASSRARGRAGAAERALRRSRRAARDRARLRGRPRAARLLVARAEPMRMSYRNRELAALLVVRVITGLGFASVYIARHAVVSAASLSYALFFFALYLAAHIVVRLTAPQADPYLLPLAALLTAIGVTEIYRLHPGNSFRQGLWIVVGVAAFSGTLVAPRHDYRRLESYKYLCGLTAIVLLVLPALPVVGQTVNGARLWVHFGGIQFQPGELAKIMLIVFLAGYLREKREVLAQGRLKDFGPLLAIWGAAMLVLVETNDLGSGLLYFGIFLAVLYVATARACFAGAGLVLFVAGATVIYKAVPRVEERVSVWIDPWAHIHTTGYQIIQSLFSIANGGFAGKGFGKGVFATTNGHDLIPYLPTDFIYSALAQELGLVGSAALLLVYMLICLRGFRIALLAQDGFSKLLAVGLTFGFALQTFIIVGGVLRLIPLTGITLPSVSYGGSSVIANFVLLAGLLLVSNRANAPREA